MQKWIVAALVTGLLAGPLWAAELKTVPVQKLPAGKPAAAASSSKPVVSDQGGAWLSAMVGYADVDHSTLGVQGFGGYLRGQRGLIGVRARYSEGFHSLRHGRELGVLAGVPLLSRGRAWAALGVSQFELERRSDSSGSAPEFHEAIGVPIELVFAPHWRHFGVELRAEANINSADSSFLFGVGLQLGKLY
ncbi:MAG: hypothetical protein Q8Q73_00640 [Stagnimonas sp.]|nr:hypothetical protein [Stagnimonas sp.]